MASFSVIGGAASAFRREVFDRLGGYDAGTLTEDMDLSLRIQEAGMRIVYAPEAIVHTERTNHTARTP